MEAIQILRKNHEKKLCGLTLTDKINKDVVAQVKNLKKKNLKIF